MSEQAPIRIDALQYGNWSEKIFRQMRQGGWAVSANPRLEQGLASAGFSERETPAIIGRTWLDFFQPLLRARGGFLGAILEKLILDPP